MLMNMAKHNRPQGEMGTQHSLKRILIKQPDRIHAVITDGDRRMMKSNHKGQITAL